MDWVGSILWASRTSSMDRNTIINGAKKRLAPGFKIKMSSNQYRKCHCGNKPLLRSSYLYNGNSYTGKSASICWISSWHEIAWLGCLVIIITMSFHQYRKSYCWDKMVLRPSTMWMPILIRWHLYTEVYPQMYLHFLTWRIPFWLHIIILINSTAWQQIL